jgi:cytochrome c biogenesis protein CcdA/thiol-disulfide isomerase/thioredoxin
VVAALGASVLVFTLLLKVSTLFIMVPPEFWQWLSGLLLIGFGVVTAFPGLWERLPFTTLLNRSGNKAVSAGYMKQSMWGDMIAGVALGPVFTSCSPTYFIVLATILPANPIAGIIYLIAYTIGLSLGLLAIALIGQRIVDKLGVASDPHGWWKRAIGVLFIIVGILVILGIDKYLAANLPSGAYGITQVEQKILEVADGSQNKLAPTPSGATSTATTTSVTALTIAEKSKMYPKAPELVAPDAYLNTDGRPITIGQFKGNKVVLIDFWTYSCINCERTTPYLNAWYDKYEDDGLVIIGVHTPEFSFEHLKDNVQAALTKEGIKYPVVLDNEYQTWNAFGNQYWPRKYLIDIDGYIVYDHAGEGDYDGAEAAIQRALKERADRLGTSAPSAGKVKVTPEVTTAQSPETYFGANRNQFLGSGTRYATGTQAMEAPDTTPVGNVLYLSGTWNFALEYAATTDANESVLYTYTAKNVYFVASAPNGVTVTVLRDGVPIPADVRGDDVDANGQVHIRDSRLYSLVKEKGAGTHTLELKVSGKGLQAYTFTFG